ncbi:MAG: hypothetical protein M0D55_18690 [Elusimicrobiota bacterium]|nr:MAG: hypothetical protein M0D55_18690 [Elusimicrobiota bacterium]
MINLALLLLAAPSFAADLPGLPGSSVVVAASTAPAAAPVAAPEPAKPALLLPPPVPSRPKGTLETAGDVARDLAVRVEYFEAGQAYYRAYTKGTHTPEENRAFVRFLEEYENELSIAKRVHALLGTWLEKKSAIKD